MMKELYGIEIERDIIGIATAKNSVIKQLTTPTLSRIVVYPLRKIKITRYVSSTIPKT
jgi:hypothetical protein